MKSIRELMNLSGRTALITGGAGHIGRAFCDTLAEAGANVAVLDMDTDRVQTTATELAQTFQVKTMSLTVNLADESAVVKAPKQVVEKLGGLDILVNCAAFVGTSNLSGWVTDFENQSVATWRAALETNLTAAFALIQAATQFLRTSGHGSIINIGSTYGVVGPDMSLYEGTAMGNPAAYAASKGGLTQLTRWLATTLAPHIRVNCISPGGIARGQDEKFTKRYIARTPMKRMGTEEDMKGTLLYLASDLSSYVTGQNILVDGGWTAW
ncbi:MULTISPECIES: SDR family oxidoreductase [unclassified Pseudodesulfovibrio]|uniref:SDR family oxidoreductase n=1 Tax=unclassified Pseudodesulfovibrio TaxID=2661612 RepID=UPI000FEBE954|nr:MULTISPECIES: SDR family oxidoreductase [unclassified Pseudodesulfovibrio]MCJ2164157.1 SDR family oxidoreductase [Pseudodesulfovibrio sp. S3-i]RWU05215.1 SDR family NAD(P)-dependent oxidoreductase [Pseudodesulfovibrio sp. S3]